MRKVLFFLLCSLISGGCALQKSVEPVIEFTTIPAAEIGGTMRLETIEGRALNTQADQKIVLYTRSGNWYVQPFANQPFTKIEADLTWRNSTHLGTEYAALLVSNDFVPPKETGVLPTIDDTVTAIAIVKGTPLFWQTWWFRAFAALIFVVLLIAYFRFRMNRLTREMNLRFEERLAERTRIAQELHDSLLQGFVGVSMHIAVAAEQLPADSSVRPQLKHVGKLIERVVEEGRNTVKGLRSGSENDFANLEHRFAELRQDLDIYGHVDFRVIVEGAAKPLCPAIADDVYHICREAVINAFRHSNADKIEVEIEYAARDFRIVVRDNGVGIDEKFIESGRENHWGLAGMKERAEKIGARLKVLSRADTGTEIELSVPNQIAFETQVRKQPLKWLAKQFQGRSKPNEGRKTDTSFQR